MGGEEHHKKEDVQIGDNCIESQVFTDLHEQYNSCFIYISSTDHLYASTSNALRAFCRAKNSLSKPLDLSGKKDKMDVQIHNIMVECIFVLNQKMLHLLHPIDTRVVYQIC